MARTRRPSNWPSCHSVAPGRVADRDGRYPLCPRGQVLGDARLIVVLEEADQTGLVDQICAKVVMDSGWFADQDPVIEPLVVAKVKPLPLQFPFEVPVGLSDQQNIRMPRAKQTDNRRPKLLCGRRSGPTMPGPVEDIVRHEHGHVTADPVALLRYVTQCLDGGAAQGR